MSEFKSEFSDTNVPTLGEVTGTAPKKWSVGDQCGYCERGWSKGFTACPQCGLVAPPTCDDCCSRLEDDGSCPECSA